MRHNPAKEAEKLISYLMRNPNFKGVAICVAWKESSICITQGDLKGNKTTFCKSIREHGNQHQ
jgi:hypothetical protein